MYFYKMEEVWQSGCLRICLQIKVTTFFSLRLDFLCFWQSPRAWTSTQGFTICSPKKTGKPTFRKCNPWSMKKQSSFTSTTHPTLWVLAGLLTIKSKFFNFARSMTCLWLRMKYMKEWPTMNLLGLSPKFLTVRLRSSSVRDSPKSGTVQDGDSGGWSFTARRTKYKITSEDFAISQT